MANTFSVTAVATSVSLDPQRRALASFTVSNTSAQPTRGRGVVVPVQGADAGWFTVVGEAARAIGPGATEQYPVQIAVPPTAPAGTCSFRLDAVNENNPDEDTTAGPTVTFEVPAPEAAKKKFPWWIVVLVAVVLIGAGVAVALIAGGGDDEKRPVASTPTTGTTDTQPTVTEPPPPPPEQAFDGVWKNPDTSSRGVDRMVIQVKDGQVRIEPDGCSKVVVEAIQNQSGQSFPASAVECKFDAPTVPFTGEPIVAPVRVSARVNVSFLNINVDVQVRFELSIASPQKDRLRVVENRGSETITYTLDKAG
jgi:hypothetical protein